MYYDSQDKISRHGKMRVTEPTCRVTYNYKSGEKSYKEANPRETNGEKNRKYSATTGSGRANSRDRGAKRDPRYVEVCAHRG